MNQFNHQSQTNRTRFQRHVWVSLTILILLLVVAPAVWAQEKQPVMQAWETANAIGSYDFTISVRQTTRPLPKLINAGLTPTTESFYIEGSTDVDSESLALNIWSQGGSSVMGSGSIEMQVNEGVALGRVDGSAWQEVDDISGMVAPDRDPLGYLNAAGKMTALGSQRDAAGGTATRYSFDINGPDYAVFMRDQMVSDLRQRNELPGGLQLGVNQQLAEMDATGEIWLNEDGLPLRQVITIAFAETELEQVSAEITTDFSSWGETPTKTTAIIGLRDWGEQVRNAAPTLAANASTIAAATLFSAFIVFYADDRRVYRAVAYGYAFLFLATPLLQAQDAHAMTEVRQAFAALHGSDEPDADSANSAPEFPESSLQVATPAQAIQAAVDDGSFVDDGIDSDGDGLTDAVEQNVTLTLPNNPDSDGDGLSDGVEVYELGTKPNSADSDGDTLSDNAEVKGFTYNGTRWHLDPLKLDSNGDGSPDNLSCTEAAGVITCSDNDGDPFPDVFDFDDDNDGVPDKVDSDPTRFIGDKASGLVDQTLSYDISGLASNQTTMVDFQLRPTDASHLWYSLSVLDWPSNDRSGQVTRVFDTALGNSGTAANGDMTLSPLLEIEMPGTTTPLPLTNAQTSLAFGDGVVGSASFAQTGADVAITLDLTTAETHDVIFYADDCTALNAGSATQTASFTGVAGNATLNWSSVSLVSELALGNRAMQVTSSSGNTICRNVPNVVNGPHANRMVDKDALADFGITVRETDSGGIYAYVPLTLLYDEAENNPVAFTGRMFFDPTSSDFGGAQNARLLWTVNVMTDRCQPMPNSYDPNPATTGDDDESQSEKVEAWCADNNNWVAAGTVTAHAYYDDWYLTGMSVQRNVDYKTATVYQDPAFTTAQSGFTPAGFSEGSLWLLAQGLDVSFMAGRASGGVRDMTVDTVKARFDSGMNGGVSDLERFHLPANAFHVERHDYRDDTGLGDLALTQAYNILDTEFTPQVATGVQDTTLLFLREHTFRKVSIGQNAVASVGANSVTINASDDATNAPLTTLASMNWAPYQYSGGAWQPYSPEAYWQTKGPHMTTALASVMDAEDAKVAGVFARAYYVGLTVGYAQFVEMNSQPATLASQVGDAEMLDYVHEGNFDPAVGTAIFKSANKILTAIKKSIGSDSVVGSYGGFVKLGNFGNKLSEQIIKEIGWSTLNSPDGIPLIDEVFKLGGSVDILNLAGLMYAVAGAVFAAISQVVGIFDEAVGDAIGIIANVFGVVATAISLASTIIQSQALLIVSSLKTLLSSVKSINGALIFAAIGTAISVGLFIFEAVASNLTFGSLAFNQAFADLVGDTLTNVLLIAIAAIPIVGQIITAIIYLVDAIINLICSVVPKAPDGSDAAARDYGCGGIAGIVSKVISWLLYNNAPLIELDRSERLNVTNLDYTLENPALGYQAGNRVTISADIETALFHNNIDNIEEFSSFILWRWMFNPAFEKKSVLDYRFVSEKETTHEDLTIGSQEAQWLPPAGGPAAFADATAYRSETISYTLPAPLTANVAQYPSEGTELYIAEGQAYLSQECARVPFIPVPPFYFEGCWLRDTRDTLHLDLGTLANFDVFPATLSEFRAMTQDAASGAYRLAWDANFPLLQDADGDGLRAVAFGGADPDDSNPDSDGDGLTDFYEILTSNSDPLLMDTDGDGLCDGQERAFQTSPVQADSDADGLLDGEEVYHLDLCDADGDGITNEMAGGWLFVYDFDGSMPRTTLVTSDPLSADADGDLYLDSIERIYGFNPNIPSASDILDMEATVDSKLVKPGDTINYSVDLTNKLRSSAALGLLDVGFNDTVQSNTGLPQSFNLQPFESESLSGSVTIRSDLTQSSAVTMTKQAGAIITNPRNQSNAYTMWLSFNETPTQLGSGSVHVYSDQSGNGRDMSCANYRSECPAIEEAALGGGYAGNGISIRDDTNQSDTQPRFLSSTNWTVADVGIDRNGFTIETWALTQYFSGVTPASDIPIIKVGDIELTLGLVLRLKNAGVTVLEDPAPLPGWAHIAWRYESGFSALFVDGVKVAEGSTDLDAALAAAVNNNFIVGMTQQATVMNGLHLDELKVYDFGRSGADIAKESTKRRTFYLSGSTAIIPGSINTNWDQPTALDDSGYNNRIRCYNDWPTPPFGGTQGGCPTVGSGIVGSGLTIAPASANHAHIYDVRSAIALPQTGGFTIASWVNKADDNSTGADNFWLVGGDNNFVGLFTHPSMAGRVDYISGSGSTPDRLYIAMAAGIRGQSGNTICTMSSEQTILATDPLFTRLTAGGDWYHLSLTYDGNRYTAYVNGVALDQVDHEIDWVDSADCNNMSHANYGQFVVGGRGRIESYFDGATFRPQFIGNKFTGQFDELQMFNYAMTAEEVDDVYWGDGPIMDLRLDEAPTSSLFADRTGTNNAVCSGNSCPLSGLPGLDNQALRFDGFNDVLQLPTLGELEMLSSDFTLSGWVNPSALNSSGMFKSVDNQLLLGIDSAGAPFAKIGATTLTGSVPLTANFWQHLALRYIHDGGNQMTAALFANGNQVASAPIAAPLTANVSLQSGPGLAFTLNGMLDRLQVFREALSDGDVAQLVTQVPAINLHLNESLGNNSPSHSGTGLVSVFCQACQMGVQGRMYGAMSTGRLTFGGAATDSEIFSVGEWVRPTQQVDTWQLLAARSNETSNEFQDNQFRVRIIPDSMRVRVDTNRDNCTAGDWLESVGTLTENNWNHVMLTYDGATLKLYINGALDSSEAAPSICTVPTQQYYIGQDKDFTDTFYGETDEFVLYPSVLSANEINELYNYQLAWYDAEQETRITIDADAPTVSLDAPNGYLSNADRILAIVATDPTSDVALVEYEVVKNGLPTGAYTAATADGDAWVFNFQPSGTGSYTVQMRATDEVGNVGTSTSSVAVDGEGVTIAPFNVEGVAAVPTQFNTASTTWDVALSGSLSWSLAQLERVEVQVLDELGASVAGWYEPTVTVSGTTAQWALGYPFDFRPNNAYTITLNAWDTAGNRTTRSRVATIDGTAPDSSLNVVGGNDGKIETGAAIQGTLVEAGAVKSDVAGLDVAFHSMSEEDASVVNYLPSGNVLHLRLDEVAEDGNTTFADSSPSGLTAFCNNGCPVTGIAGRVAGAPVFDNDTSLPGPEQNNSILILSNVDGALPDGPISFGAWVNDTAGFSGNFLTLNSDAIGVQLTTDRLVLNVVGQPADVKTWSDAAYPPNEWHFIMLTLDGADATVYIDGDVVHSSPLTAVPADISLLYLGIGLQGQLDDVVMYDRALSAAEVGRLADGGTAALHLRFDDLAIDAANRVTDSSINGLTVAANRGPLEIAQGAVGAAAIHLESGDQLSVTDDALDLSSGHFTQVAWVHPEANVGYVFSANSGFLIPYPYWLLLPTSGSNGMDMKVGFNTGTSFLSATATDILTPNAWNFVATSFDGTTYRIYVDGAEVYTTQAFAGTTPAVYTGAVDIGGNGFAGMLDEVQIYHQALSAEIIATEYAKGWQAATLATRAESADWSYSTPDLAAGPYEIRLRSHDANGNYSIGHDELPQWRGYINDPTSVPLAVNHVSASADSTSTLSLALLTLVTVTLCSVVAWKRRR